VSMALRNYSTHGEVL